MSGSSVGVTWGRRDSGVEIYDQIGMLVNIYCVLCIQITILNRHGTCFCKCSLFAVAKLS